MSALREVLDQQRDPPRPNGLRWLLLTVVLIAIDQVTKWIAVSSLQYQQSEPFIPGFWNWTLLHNYGAAFSFLSSAGGWQHWLFSALAVLISLGLALWLRVTPRADWRTALPIALVIAGALGNLVDRVRFGYVVDFIDWYVGEHHWPAFNIADACIVGGAIGLVLFSFGEGQRAPKGG